MHHEAAMQKIMHRITPLKKKQVWGIRIRPAHHMISWIYSASGSWTNLTTGATFCLSPQLLPLELLKCSRIIREVRKTYNANGNMLRRSDQLLLTAENHHFEGSTHLSEGELSNSWR